MSVRDVMVPTPAGRLFARVWGTLAGGLAPIVLLHDSLGSVELWRDFPAVLAEVTGRGVVAYDRLGFGQSDARAGRVGFDFIRREAEDAIAPLREALGIERMVLFGHSVGGGMAVAAGAAFADETVAVVTESAQCFVEDRTLAGLRVAREAFAQTGQVERLGRYHGDKAAWVLEAWLGTWLSAEFSSWTLDDALRRLRCPLLVLHGSEDEYGSAAQPERIAREAGGGAELVMLEGRAHVPHREDAGCVLGPVVRFLEELD